MPKSTSRYRAALIFLWILTVCLPHRAHNQLSPPGTENYEDNLIATSGSAAAGGGAGASSVANDERPYFINAPRPFQAVVPLDAVVGQSVYRFEAVDPDPNSRLEYRLVLDRSGNGMFEVDADSGNVVVKRANGFKLGEEYRISVRAEDVNAHNQQFTEEEVLSIKGGERAPQFYAGLYEISVPENKEVKSKITQVKALSFNNKPLRYELTGDGNETFRIDAITGDLYLEKALDYDDIRNPRKYYLSLFAREENNGLSSSVRLHITIEDNNDNTPKFQFPSQQVYVNEDVAKGHNVATVTAFDADSGPNGEITFYIVNNDNFTINSTKTTNGGVDTNTNSNTDGDDSSTNFLQTSNGGAATINSNTAVIRVSNPAGLDADHGNREYKLIVIAVDRGVPARTGTAMVRVFARNTNDEQPVFTQSMYHATIQEDAQQGMTVATVTAIDIDGDKVEYGFADDFLDNGLFTIDKDNGVIQLARSNALSASAMSTATTSPLQLDQAKYVLKVIAVDDGSCCRGNTNPTSDAGAANFYTSPLNDIRHTSEATVVVSVIDVNDHKPVFFNCSQYEANRPHVAENADPGTYVTTMHASDEDSGANGQVEYEIETFHDQPKLFQIDPVTGAVRTVAIFDREAPSANGNGGSDVMITVLARDKGYRPLVGGCSFKIELDDVNDNAPVFERELYEFTLKQDTPAGPFRSVRAVDRDAGPNAEVEYSLTSSESQAALDLFGIDNETGWLYTKRAIPATPKEYRLQAIATDHGGGNGGGSGRLWSKVDVIIRITDVNSRPPVWINAPSMIELNETAPRNHEVITLKAKNVDLPQNKHIYYELLDGRTPDTNSEKHFILQRHKDLAREDVAILRVYKSLDYEHVPVYNLTIQAKNNLDPQLDSILYLPVRLIDKNDEVPLFATNPVLTILEGEPANVVVGRVRAEDADVTEAFNQVQYFPDAETNGVGGVPPNGDWKFFNIDRDTGVITSRTSFDREQRATYTLAVLAQDSAPSDVPGVKGPNTNTVYVRIEIADKNDNAPYFEHLRYTASVKESAVMREPVITLQARDADESPRLVYQIVGGNINGAFAIHPTLGVVTVNGKLDFEQLAVDGRPARYDLDVAVSDGAFSNRTRLTIFIQDVNDMPPEFAKKLYETAIKEEDASGLPKFLPLTDLIAIDGDRMRNDKIRYSLVGQGAGDVFVIPNDLQGRIQITQPLDRDAPHGQPEWIFTVLAKDEDGKGLTGFTDVKVKLIDVNDNDPFFEEKYLRGQVRENSPVGTRVMKISATDYDDPNVPGHAEVVYDIYQNVLEPQTNRQIFNLDARTGLITTAWSGLDREQQDSYTIVVRATDGGGRVGTGTATILIQDENDSPPRFLQRKYETTIEEIASAKLLPDAPILTVEVEDADLTNDFVFGIAPCATAAGSGGGSGNVDTGLGTDDGGEHGCDRFHIDADSSNGAARLGHIYVVKQLDYEDPRDRSGFRFRVYVNDRGSRRFPQDFAEIRINLIDINDNVPKFVKQNDVVEEYEDVPVGKNLTRFVAHDADREGRSLVRYAISRDSDPRRQFNVSSDGTVRVAQPLDRETIETHFIEVLGIDDGQPPLTSTATLTVKLKDVNDNAPHLAYDYQPVLMEGAPGGTFIAEIIAADPDTGAYNGAPFTFETPIPNPTQDDFELRFRPSGGQFGQGSAQIFSRRTFDREKQKEYAMPIIISDHGGMSGTSTLTITIGDVNDHLMEAGEKHITVYNYRGKMPDAHIGRVHVEDLDDWDLPDKTFTWHADTNTGGTLLGVGVGVGTPTTPTGAASTSKPEQFELDRSTGMLTMRRGTRAGRYSFKVDVREDGPPGKKKVTSSVIVNVKEVTDEALKNSGSLRLHGITAEELIRKPTDGGSSSLYEKLRSQLAKITKANVVEIFSVITRARRPYTPYTDVRYAAHGSPFFQPTLLNGAVLVNRRAVEAATGLTISMAPIDLCVGFGMLGAAGGVGETEPCGGEGCHTRTYVEDLPTLVNANTTALVGVTVQAERQCLCAARDFSEQESCENLECYNGGECSYDWDPNPYCRCPRGYDGPRCQQTTRSFGGKGWAWLPPLGTCERSHLSFEFTTYTRDGLLLYNGPLSAEVPEVQQQKLSSQLGTVNSGGGETTAFYQENLSRQQLMAGGSARLQPAAAAGGSFATTTDFIAIELVDGKLRVHVDFGGGGGGTVDGNGEQTPGGALVLEVPTTSTLADSSWHRVDVFWDQQQQQVKVQIDNCRGANISDPGDFYNSNSGGGGGGGGAGDGWHNVGGCEVTAQMPGFYYQLNVNQPLQLGGSAVPVGAKRGFTDSGFRGCVRNLIHNGIMYDLQTPGDFEDSQAGCPEADKQCSDRAGNPECIHGLCDANLLTYRCICEPGYRGSRCQYATKEMSFEPGSFTQYDLRDNLAMSPLYDDVQLRFRTRTTNSGAIAAPGGTAAAAVQQLFYMGSASGGEFLTLEIRNRTLQLRYDVNSVLAEEYTLRLDKFQVDDGRWHTARVERFGADTYLTVDKGDGRRYAELIAPSGARHKTLNVRKQNVFAGGHLGVLTTRNTFLSPRTVLPSQFAGGDSAMPLSQNSVMVLKDFVGCLDDIRINGRYLPLDKTNDDQTYAEIVQQQNVTEGCSSRAPCAENPLCPTPMVCVDIWREHECRCPPGFVKRSGVGGGMVDTCVDLDECEAFAISSVCLNGGVCENIIKTNKFDKAAGYICHCPYGYTGQNCGALRGEQRLGVAHSVWYILLGCLSLLMVCVLIGFLLTYSRQRRRRRYDDKAGLTVEPDDDIRENIVTYNEEGAGEEDVKAYDITPLRVPVRGGGPPGGGGDPAAATMTGVGGVMPFYAVPSKRRTAGGADAAAALLSPRQQQQQLGGELIHIPDGAQVVPFGATGGNNIADIEDILARRLDDADNDPMAPPYDELRTYAYEGSGSRSISLSSLSMLGSVGGVGGGGGGSDSDLDFRFVRELGPKFQHLAEIYSADDTTTTDDNAAATTSRGTAAAGGQQRRRPSDSGVIVARVESVADNNNNNGQPPQQQQHQQSSVVGSRHKRPT